MIRNYNEGCYIAHKLVLRASNNIADSGSSLLSILLRNLNKFKKRKKEQKKKKRSMTNLVMALMRAKKKELCNEIRREGQNKSTTYL